MPVSLKKYRDNLCAPGEMFKINCVRTTSSPPYNIPGSHIANNPHWSEYLNFSWNVGTSYFVIDGDAPSGTEMLVYNSFPGLSETANNGTYNGYLNFFTWANATAGWTSQNSLSGNLALKSAKYLFKVFVIKRTDPPKPQIVDDAPGSLSETHSYGTMASVYVCFSTCFFVLSVI